MNQTQAVAAFRVRLESYSGGEFTKSMYLPGVNVKALWLESLSDAK
eukprot:CAMPEP_0195543842 /NCGR_PEP_ID=MMETSP0794_2-20130614/52322_1 /TAXON_ID=515487 /ORGANISM="Stephanopyxis turris, Strain CCMP 815" /LENGTH=45 /DNA_ID= /DNA_START= /DNA_END= /DNA_ORIENTATION=